MAEAVQVSLRFPGTAPAPQVARLIQQAEAAGFDGAGILDSQMISRDTFVILGMAAAQTTRLRLFPAVSNPFTRHISVLAGATQTVEEMAPGRVACVIGSGYTAAFTIGRKPATLAEMRAAILDLKALLAGEAVDFGGTRGRIQFAGQRPIPVIMAASGPKAVELAAEVADGVMLQVGFTPGIVAAALEHLERGARRGGRRLEDLEVIWAARTCTAATMAEARRRARPTAVHWGLLHAGGHWLQYAGLQLPELEIPPAVWEIYPDLGHARDWEQAIAATSFVPDEVVARLCDALGLIGTPDHCAERIVELADLGIRSIYLMPLETYVGPDREIRAFSEVVFPRLRASGYR